MNCPIYHRNEINNAYSITLNHNTVRFCSVGCIQSFIKSSVDYLKWESEYSTPYCKSANVVLNFREVSEEQEKV